MKTFIALSESLSHWDILLLLAMAGASLLALSWIIDAVKHEIKQRKLMKRLKG